MKTIKKFWGVVFILALLSTLFVGAIPQAAAGNYAFDGDNTQPSANNGILSPSPGFGITDIVQVGNTIVATCNNQTLTGLSGARLYRSTDAGVTWSRLNATGLAGTYWDHVAMAQDNTNIIAVVDTGVMPNVVYLSNNGGANFAATGATPGWIKGIAISSLIQGNNVMTIVGNTQGPRPLTSNQGFVQRWNIGSVAPAWAAVVGTPAEQDYCGVAYSTNFGADQSMLVVSHNSTFNDRTDVLTDQRAITRLHVFSFNTNVWDLGVDVSYPRTLYQGAATTTADGSGLTDNVSVCGPVKFALSPDFYMGDSAAQIGFLTVPLSSNATTVAAPVGGIYRINGATTTAIKSGMAFNGLAWDGTNLMASQNGTWNALTSGTPIWRCADALGNNPTVLQSSTFKAPATGNNTRVFFAGGLAYAASSGANGGISRSTDNGKSWNGYKLLNTTFANVVDFWISPDGARQYTVTDDGVDTNVWRKSGSTWERVMIIPAGVGQGWLVRADAGAPDTVYLGRQGQVNMFKALDAGEYTWSPRSCSQLIQDFAVQDALTLYVAVGGGATTVVRSTQGAFTWDAAVQTGLAAGGGGNCYSMTLIADNNVLIGGSAGGVAYTTDGAAWQAVARNLLAGGNVVVTASGLTTGSTIWAGSSAGALNGWGLWVIGTNTAGTGWTIATAPLAAPTSLDGIAYANGVLYLWDDGVGLKRCLFPTGPRGYSPASTEAVAAAGVSFIAGGTLTLNALQVFSTGVNNTIVGRDVAVTDTFQVYTEYLTTAASAPVLTYPINNAKIDINSIAGGVNGFVFTWTAPSANSAGGYTFDLNIFLDEAGNVPIAAAPGIAVVRRDGGIASYASTTAGFAFAPQPGQTYYWQVEVAAGLPLLSYWSTMGSFSIQQLAAIVPLISTPENGGEVNTVNPAFSWTPISGATGYRFELSTTDDFSDIVYTVDPATAGASVPSILKLIRGTQYFWHVKALTPAEGEWSTTANFIVAELPVTTSPTPQVTITTAPQPTIIISQPPVTTTQIVIPPPETKEVNPSYIWAIIIVGAVLVIAVIVLIVRTRRTV